MGSDERTALVDRFFAGTGATYDFMVHAATFGIDRRWKRSLVALVPMNAQRVLDLACGTGISTLAIAQARPRADVTGVELREEYLAYARRKPGAERIEWVRSRAEDYRSNIPYDCVSSSYLAKYADLPRLVAAAYGWLRPGGRFIAHDFTFPPKPYLVATWRLYFALLRACGPFFPAWREIYRDLPALIEHSRWPFELSALLVENGFTRVRRYDLTLYGSAIIVAERAGADS